MPAPATWPSLEPFAPPFTHMLPAPAPSMQAPRAEVTADAYDATADTRQITLHLYGTSPQIKLSIPAQALVSWSVGPNLATMVPTNGQYLVGFEGISADGADIQLTLRGSRPVEIDLRGLDGAPTSGANIEALRHRLPDWVTLISYSYRTARVRI